MTATISGVRLENFRAFDHLTSIPLGRITLLYGQNSAGKSSIIKSLLMLKQTFETSTRGDAPSQAVIRFSGDSVDLGSFATTVSGHDLSHQIAAGVELQHPQDRSQRIELVWRCGADGRLTTVTLTIAGKHLVFHAWTRRRQQFLVLDQQCVDEWMELLYPHDSLLEQLEPMIQDLRLGVGLTPVFKGVLLPDELSGLVYVGNGSPVPGATTDLNDYGRAIDQTGRPEVAVANDPVRRWREITRPFLKGLTESFRDTTYIGPLRREPQRFQRYAPSDHWSVGASGDQMVAHFFERPSTLLKVNNYLGMMELPYRVQVVTLGAQQTVGSVIYLTLVNQATGLEVSSSDVGVGYSQVLPLIAQSVLSQSSLVCIEQPELHLHPAMQARLGDMFIDQAIGGGDVQFLIETHSESLMLRILRRVREGTLPPGDVRVLYVDQDERGSSTVVQLPINRFGEFEVAWPRGFFDERLEELGF